ncbi:MAG TPA: response regulator [Methylomirabilota bacterium]|nr:response regulator [Methylomirabilota bacterium]
MPKVLVVDDSLSVRKVVERALEAKRFDVISAASGTEAVEMIGQEAPDVIVCDVIMPDMDGYQICEFVRGHARLGATPVLLISGIVNSTVLERASKVRANDVLRKPFAADELLSKIDALIPVAFRSTSVPEPVLPRPTSEVFTAAAAAEPAEPVAREEEAVPAPDLKTTLSTLAALPGVSLAVLVDREGFLIEAAGEMLLEAEVAGALAASLAESSSGIGRELGQGGLQSLILEYDSGVILLNGVGPGALLALLLRDPAVLGKVRYYVKKALTELLEIV